MSGHAENGSVRINDTDMYYASFGDGPETLIVLPGLSDGLSTVKGLAGILSLPYRKHLKEYTVYMFSRKNNMPEGYSINDMADDQAEAMKQLGIEQASVLGVSQGGMIAQALAVRHPERVKKLVIAVSAPDANDLAKENINRWLDIVREGNHGKLLRDTAEHYYSEPYLKKYRLMYPFLGLVGKPKSYERFIRNAEAILGFDIRKDLSRIACPVWIIAGANDQIVGVNASKEMHERIPQSELYIYEEFGHAPNEEDKEFYERIFAWLNRH